MGCAEMAEAGTILAGHFPVEVTQRTAGRETFPLHRCSQSCVLSELKVTALYISKAEC